MEKPTKEEIEAIWKTRYPNHLASFRELEMIELGRLSAFKEMRDWAKNSKDYAEDKAKWYREGHPFADIENGKSLAFEEVIEFAEAKMKEGKP